MARSALLTLLGGLVMIGAAAQTWATVRVPGPLVDGVRLPEEVITRSGAALAPTAIVAGLVGLLVAVVLALAGPVARLWPGAAGAGRLLASAGAVAVLVMAVMAQAADVAIEVVTLGGGDPPTVETSPARFLHLAGALLAVVAVGLTWRRPGPQAEAPSRVDAPSRYTVEAVRGTPTAPPAGAEPDEWDLAAADDDEDIT